MKWFPKSKTKIKSEKPSIKREKPSDSLKKMCDSQAEAILTLEKEAVYWKEKALNFRRFHQ